MWNYMKRRGSRWRTELRAEAGYQLSDLQLLQPKMARPVRQILFSTHANRYKHAPF